MAQFVSRINSILGWGCLWPLQVKETLETFCKSKAWCPALRISLLPHFYPHTYKSDIILVAVTIMQISFRFTDIHNHLIHFHHLQVSHDQV